jgi:uncharacterized membrane protein YqiK
MRWHSTSFVGQMRLVMSMMDIEEISTKRDKFLLKVSHNMEAALKKIGIKRSPLTVSLALTFKLCALNLHKRTICT